jgi:hypothetical protein
MDTIWDTVRGHLATALDIHLRGGEASSFSWAVQPGTPPKVGLFPTGSQPWDGPEEELEAARAEAVQRLEGLAIPATMPAQCPAIAWKPLSAHGLLAHMRERNTG